MAKQTVLLLFGGESSEHEVSIMSARNVFAAMDGDKYDSKLCYIDRAGKWWLLDGWTDELSRHGGRELIAAMGQKCFVTLPGNEVVSVDVIFPALHGAHGEDGTVQGLAALLHIPIVGCGVTTSALCMDKQQAKRVLQASGIPVVPGREVKKHEPVDVAAITAQLGADMFVKPASAGSSVGVTHVTDSTKLVEACQVAWQHSSIALIEKTVHGRELEVAVLGTPPRARASGVGEIMPRDAFYSYDEKYAESSQSQVIIDADIDETLAETIRSRALRAYEVLGCSGLARVDFLVDDTEAFVGEVNTMPGFTNISMYPKLWQHQGMRYPELVDKLITDALE